MTKEEKIAYIELLEQFPDKIEDKDVKLLLSCEWAIPYLFQNPNLLDILCLSSPAFISNLFHLNIDYSYLIEGFCLCDKITRMQFIYYSIMNKMPLTDSDFIRLLCSNPNDFYQQLSLFEQEQPRQMINHHFNDNELMIMRDYLQKYFDVFFEIERIKKFNLLQYAKELSTDFINRYQIFIDLYKKHSHYQFDYFLTNLLIHHKESELVPYLNQNLKFIESGSYCSTFLQENGKVLKLNKAKHEENLLFPKIFLIAPTTRKVIYDENDKVIGIIEEQDYLEKTYHNEYMKVVDVVYFLQELDRQGFVLTDPKCEELAFDNFGFLKDYHDAYLGNYSSHEDLPEWFKKRPIVLYDIDLLYEKEEKQKKM